MSFLPEDPDGYRLFQGRFQPPTKAHFDIFDMMSEGDVVVVIRGKETKKSPFPLDYTINLIKESFPKLEVISWKNGYFPDIVNECFETQGKKITSVICGTDRAAEYFRMLNNEGMDLSIVSISRTNEDTSASLVRKSLIENKPEEFKKLMNPHLHEKFEEMKNILEDGEGSSAPTNTTSGVENKEKPMDKKLEKRKTYSQFTAEK